MVLKAVMGALRVLSSWDLVARQQVSRAGSLPGGEYDHVQWLKRYGKFGPRRVQKLD
jgi:hypothetical protein